LKEQKQHSVENSRAWWFDIQLNRTQFEGVKALLEAEGFRLVGDNGQLQYSGVTFSYSYKTPGNTLTITILGKSMPASFIPDSRIEALVRGEIDRCLDVLQGGGDGPKAA